MKLITQVISQVKYSTLYGIHNIIPIAKIPNATIPNAIPNFFQYFCSIIRLQIILLLDVCLNLLKQIIYSHFRL